MHPTQLSELAAAVLPAIAARGVARRWATPGVPALVFAAGFLAFRAQPTRPAIRVPSSGTALPSTALVGIYLAAGLAALFLLVRAWRAGAQPALTRVLAS